MKRHISIRNVSTALCALGLSLLLVSGAEGAQGSPANPLGPWQEASRRWPTAVREGWLINERGEAAAAHLQVVATDWGLIGELDASGRAIYWANGSVWTRDVAGWDVSGLWYYGGTRNRPCWIEPWRDGLRLTNERGMTAAGRLQIVADGWGGLVGTIVGPQISWENGTVWVREPRVRRFR